MWLWSTDPPIVDLTREYICVQTRQKSLDSLPSFDPKPGIVRFSWRRHKIMPVHHHENDVFEAFRNRFFLLSVRNHCSHCIWRVDLLDCHPAHYSSTDPWYQGFATRARAFHPIQRAVQDNARKSCITMWPLELWFRSCQLDLIDRPLVSGVWWSRARGLLQILPSTLDGQWMQVLMRAVPFADLRKLDAWLHGKDWRIAHSEQWILVTSNLSKLFKSDQ